MAHKTYILKDVGDLLKVNLSEIIAVYTQEAYRKR